ncbi:hypothetical protein C8R45DRAFT_919453 [Mycena sanguinolenta]|nr:hypothetical protein C8R45DRAFT_919453 [Mycena sanguinolenta]
MAPAVPTSPPHCVVVAKINKHDVQNSFRRLLIIPTSAEYEEIDCVTEKYRLHPQAAQDLKVLDLVCLLGMILGVPSPPPGFAPPSSYETKMTWITVHSADENGEVSEQDLTHSLPSLFSKHSGWAPPSNPKGTVNTALNLRPIEATLQQINPNCGSDAIILCINCFTFPARSNMILYLNPFLLLPARPTISPLPLGFFCRCNSSLPARLKECLAAIKQEVEQQKRKRKSTNGEVAGIRVSSRSFCFFRFGGRNDRAISLNYLDALFTSKAELEHDGGDVKSQLTPRSQDILSTLLNVYKPRREDEQPLGILHDKVQIYFAMLANWKAV